MMGELAPPQSELFYEFCLEKHIPLEHLLRRIDQFLDFTGLRQHLQPFYSSTGRPSIDPELTMRILIIGYCYGIRSERRLCEEVHFNLAYRWFCRLGLEGEVPDHSTFSKNRHGRFRDSQLFRFAFESWWSGVWRKDWWRRRLCGGCQSHQSRCASCTRVPGQRGHRVGPAGAQESCGARIPRCPGQRCAGRKRP